MDTAHLVAVGFIKAYYKCATTNPSNLHKFFLPSSNFSFSSGTTDNTTSTGSDGIRERIVEWGIEEAVFDLDESSLDAQESVSDSIIVCVTGSITVKGAEATPFVQTFLLQKQVSRVESSRVEIILILILTTSHFSSR